LFINFSYNIGGLLDIVLNVQKNSFLSARGTLSVLIGDHNSTYSASLFRDYAQFRGNTAELNGSVTITNSAWISQNLFVKGILEDAMPDYSPRESCGIDGPEMDSVLKYVFNGQHHLAATKWHIEQFKSLPWIIWTRMHESPCRSLRTNLNDIAGQQMATSYLDK